MALSERAKGKKRSNLLPFIQMNHALTKSIFNKLICYSHKPNAGKSNNEASSRKRKKKERKKRMLKITIKVI